MKARFAIAGILAAVAIGAYILYQSMKMDQPHKHTNRLIKATSPYLLQHAHNPVDWYEWNEEALTKAKNEDKPILVSIGYSSCHWCHVMERESFENEEVASVMNEFFICIKVDREERPDIDQVYMEAVQAMGANGGWPLNVFLTPDQKPFYGGTYFPPKDWVQLLTNIHKAFGLKRIELEASAEDIADALRRSDLDRFTSAPNETLLAGDLDTLYSKLEQGFDKTWGGMNRAPKFPMPGTWQMLMRYYVLTNNKAAYDQLVVTLKRIAMGGIHDQLAGGFARYSVDTYWFAPHFEKMLYDNAQMMSLYAEAYALNRDPEMQQVVEGIYDWINNEMTNAEGGFYSALDADSEGVEGKYYIWNKDELDSLLGNDATLFSEYFSVKDTGNWEHQSNILIRQATDSAFVKEHNLTLSDWDEKLGSMKKLLLSERSRRARPGLDDKIITAWNAMMITGLCDAYRYLGEEKYLKAALRAMEFIEQNLKEDEILYRSYKGKRSATSGFLDDYAFMIQGYVALYQVTFDEDFLTKATQLMEYTLSRFYDAKDHFFYYGSEANLIVRRKEVFDNVIPSSNSVMARNLLQLGLILERSEWTDIANEMILPLSQLISQEPNYMHNWAIGLMESKTIPAEIVIIGSQANEFRKEMQQSFQPFSITMGSREGSNLPLLEGKQALDSQTTVYVCFNRACRKPVHSSAEALEQLKGSQKLK